MASMFGQLPETVRLLDAGAGAGALTSAFVSRCCTQRDGVRAIEATLYELDRAILASLQTKMSECQDRCSESGIRFAYTIHSTDFIQEISARLAGNLFDSPPPSSTLRLRIRPIEKSMPTLRKGALCAP